MVVEALKKIQMCPTYKLSATYIVENQLLWTAVHSLIFDQDLINAVRY